MRLDEFRELDVIDAPAAVADAAVERRRTDDVAGEADRGSVEAFGDCHAAAFGFRADRADREMFAQRRATAVMHEARGRADVGIGVAGDILFDEVDEAGVALEQPEQLKCRFRAGFPDLGNGRRRRLRRRDRCGDRCRGRRCDRGCPVAQPADIDGQFAAAEDGEKRSDGDGKPADEGQIRFGHEIQLLLARVNGERSCRPRDEARSSLEGRMPAWHTRARRGLKTRILP